MGTFTEDPNLLRLLDCFNVGASISNPGKGILAPANGCDSHRQIEVSPELLADGGEIALPKHFDCDYCGGLHVFSSPDQPDCDNCGGAGVLVQVCGLTKVRADCGNCLGTGKEGAFMCPSCRSVADRAPDEFLITVAKGSNFGDVVALPGYGGQGRGGGKNGTLYVKLV